MREQRGDQLRGNRAADQRLCFRYTDSIIHLVSITLAIFCVCTAWLRGRTGLVVRASDSGSGDLGSILGRVGVLFP